MDTPIEEQQHISKRKIRGALRIGTAKHRAGKSSITREKFHALVRKAAQPIKKANESVSASTETSESRRSDDYTGKNTH